MTTPSPDLINGLFEIIGSGMMLMDVRRMYIDKGLHGISIWPRLFFIAWGFWNLFFYPSLAQWLSLYGGVAMVLVQVTWLGQYLWYHHVRDWAKLGAVLVELLRPEPPHCRFPECGCSRPCWWMA